MTTSRLAFLTALGLAVASTFARPAHAESSVKLDYHAPSGCPSQADFVVAVTARGSRFDAAQASSRLQSVNVSIRKGAEGFEGTLRTEATEGTSAVREVHARECSEVASGLAIVAAIALSGAAEESANVMATERAPSESSTVPVKSTPPPAPKPAPDTKPHFKTSTFKRDPLVEVGPGTLRFDHVRTYTLSAGADFGLLPGLVLPRYEFSTSLANLVTPPALASYLVGPILEGYWDWLGPATVHNQGLATNAMGVQAGVRSCSAFTYDTQGLTALFCGEFGVGWLELKTKNAQGEMVQKKGIGFGTAGVGFDAQYKLSSLLYFGLRLGGRAQFGGMSVERGDGSQVFAAQLFGAYAQAGLGLQF